MYNYPVFEGAVLETSIQKLPRGAVQMSAYLDAIHQADLARDRYWRLRFRFRYASEAAFRDDPPKAMPMAAQFASIFEEQPDALPEEIRAYIAITEMAISPIASLPQVPMAHWTALMEKYESLVQRYQSGRRTYWWQMYWFYRYVDKEKAIECFRNFWKTERDELSDCLACEQSYAVQYSLMMGDRAAADEYARPLEQGSMKGCGDSPRLVGWLIWKMRWIEEILRMRPCVPMHFIRRAIGIEAICPISVQYCVIWPSPILTGL
jgi:hypothetical protein